ncbi:MAG TPA: hypothetical protein VLZ77_02280 [Acidimicrobiales bacterium]|nr:hypothetical protein [Acidimicrobiales bacterium]
MPSPDDPPGAFDPPLASPVAQAPARANGHGEPPGGPGGVPPGRPLPGPSTRPALVVVGVIAALFVGGIVLEAVSGNQGKPAPSPRSIATAKGAVLRAVPARPLLKAIVSDGQPPDDLLDALAVPARAAPVAGSAVDRGVELYDRSVRFEVPASQADVIAFFRAQLPAEQWRRLSQGPSSTATGYQVLVERPASDGLEWELGVTVAPTVFPTPAARTGTTAFTLRLFARSDQD